MVKLILLVCLCMLRTVLLDSNVGECFCKLKGEIDDCSCKVENVDSFNNFKIYPRLSRLLEKNYFRYYKVNMFKKCPFDSDSSGKCGSKSCAVDECREDQIPVGIKNNHSHKNKYTQEAQETKNTEGCENKEDATLGYLDYTLTDEHQEELKNWKEYDDAQQNFCELEDEDSPDAKYYDLVLNPERFTGYTGPSAVNVWKLIYDQNCFKPDQKDYASFLNPQQEKECSAAKSDNHVHSISHNASFSTGLCLEKRVFFRMISGFHTSINVDVTANWLIPASGWGDATWGPNLEEFKKRFDPELTYGEGPNRLKNLYFTYLVELRALAKAAPYLNKEMFYTGNHDEDQEVQEGITDILEAIKSFPDHFDESSLFQGDRKKLKEDFKIHFRNISHVMDCVGCDKCRLWGKLQITGMGTALKILFSGESMGPSSTVTQADKMADIPFQLTRGEIVALFNSIGRLSKSIHELETFRQLMNK